MKNLTLENIVRVTGGAWHGETDLLSQEVTSITTDSRKAEPGCLFVPIVGERADGHDYIPQVAASGALCTLSEKDLKEAPISYIRVESSLQAIKDIAAFYLEQMDIPVVGVTGSVGKTSTKEMIASVLSQKYDTLKTQGNFNNELGLPLTVFRLREEHQIAVLEMGINHFGEMTRLASIARPDTGVITNIGTAHLEFLGDRDGILRAKTEMLDFIRPEGHIVLNGDDDKLCTVRESHGKIPVFFGLDPKNDVYASEIRSLGLQGTTCRIHIKNRAFSTKDADPEGSVPTAGEEVKGSFSEGSAPTTSEEEVVISVHVPIPGIHMVMNALAAAAIGRIYGLTTDEIRQGIESVQSMGGRFHQIKTDHLLIVDDCYNANPGSVKAAIDVLKESPGRRVAVLGDMFELGENEEALHREVGRHAVESGIDCLICAGGLSKAMAEEAEKASAEKTGGTQVFYRENREDLLNDLKSLIREGDTVLVKASHSMGFEKIVEALRAL